MRVSVESCKSAAGGQLCARSRPLGSLFAFSFSVALNIVLLSFLSLLLFARAGCHKFSTVEHACKDDTSRHTSFCEPILSIKHTATLTPAVQRPCLPLSILQQAHRKSMAEYRTIQRYSAKTHLPRLTTHGTVCRPRGIRLFSWIKKPWFNQESHQS